MKKITIIKYDFLNFVSQYLLTFNDPKNFMKNLLPLIYAMLCLFIFINVSGQQASQKTDRFITLLENRSDGLKISHQIPVVTFNTVSTRNGNFTEISVDRFSKSYDLGNPDLPVTSKLIEVPSGAEVKIHILSYQEKIIDLSQSGYKQVLPAQRSVSKSEDPDKVEFYFNADVYNRDEFFSKSLVWYEETGIMRGVRIGNLHISPFSYNPVQNKLKVFENLVFEVIFENPDFTTTQTEKIKYYSPLYRQLFDGLLNYSGIKAINQRFPVKYVIVSDRMFENALQPFISWKQKKGFHVISAYTDQIGTTTTAIKNYLQGLYTSATENDPAPSFVLFVGDIAQIPTYNGQSGSHVTDLYYFCYDGVNDHVPDVTYGRFSANNLTQLQPQIDKTLEYEMYTMPNPSYLDEVVMVSGVDASHAPTWGNGQINYGTTYYFNAAHGITSHTYLYPLSGSSAAQIIAHISNGVGYGNYTAHCSPSGWADPSFETSNIPGLQNAHKYGLLVGNCCQSSQFNDAECFAEAILRVANKGAVGYIGGSNSTYWDEDFFWGVGYGTVSANPTYEATTLGAYDRTFHDHGEAATSWSVTQGQMVIGGNLAVEQSNSGSKLYYWEIYNLMGDPSLMVYMSQPDNLTADYQEQLIIGLTSLTVNTVPDALVAMSLNGQLIASVISDNSGVATLNFPTFTEPCNPDIVITKQNYKPFTGTISVIPGNTPYVIYNHHSLNDSDGNNNGLADFGETIGINLALANVGTVSASGLHVTLTANDDYITIVDSAYQWGNMPGQDTIEVANAFSFNIDTNVPDQHKVQFFVTATADDKKESWTSKFTVTVNAPILQLMNFTVNDATGGNNNGRLDRGETVKIQVKADNSGHADLLNLQCRLSCSDTNIHIITPSTTIANASVNGNNRASFIVFIDPKTPVGNVVEFAIHTFSGEFEADINVIKKIGLIIEDWETGTTTNFAWNTSYSNTWAIDNNNNYEGDYSLRSSQIPANAFAKISVTLDVLANDSVSFYKKVSCQPNLSSMYYDYMEFSIDGESKGKWAGEIDWSRESFAVPAGMHQLAWKYKKDASVTNGSDCAWIDYIFFPMHDIGSSVQTIEFLSQPVTNIRSGKLYSYPIQVSDPVAGNTPVVYAIEKPVWLTLTDNGDGTALLSGTPDIAGVNDILVVLSAFDGEIFGSQIFNINVGWPEGIDNSNNGFIASLYPNPANQKAIFKLITKKSVPVNANVVSVAGKILGNICNQRSNEGENNWFIDTYNLAPGMYIIQGYAGNQTFNLKFNVIK